MSTVEERPQFRTRLNYKHDMVKWEFIDKKQEGVSMDRELLRGNNKGQGIWAKVTYQDSLLEDRPGDQTLHEGW